MFAILLQPKTIAAIRAKQIQEKNVMQNNKYAQSNCTLRVVTTQGTAFCFAWISLRSSYCGQSQHFLARRTAEPQNRRTAEPQNRRTAEPQNRRTAEPQNRRTAEPQNRRTAEPQNRRTAEPQVGRTRFQQGVRLACAEQVPSKCRARHTPFFGRNTKKGFLLDIL